MKREHIASLAEIIRAALDEYLVRQDENSLKQQALDPYLDLWLAVRRGDIKHDEWMEQMKSRAAARGETLVQAIGYHQSPED